MVNNHRYCVIMCGGIGSRFWPYSRTSRPKQFIDFLGTGRSLLQMTFDRLQPLVPTENIIIITNERYAPLVREQMPEISDSQLLLEPARRNTAPCIAWAAWHIAARDPQASIIVTPCDQLITRELKFVEAVERAFEFVESHDALLTLGVKPTRPDTNFGYIQIGDCIEPDICRVKTFTDKPAADLARVFVDTGEFFWNSGIFLWSAHAIKKELIENAPDLAITFERGAEYFGTTQENVYMAENFPACISISIDEAVMEKAKNVYVQCVDFGWNNFAAWSALYEAVPKNRDMNVQQNCNVLAYESTGNIFAVSGDKLVVACGLKDYIVADSDDVLLICPMSEDRRIRQMFNDARLAFGEKYL